MKRILVIHILLLLFKTSVWSQAPQGFNYQAVMRDANGDILANTNVTMKFTIQISNTVMTTIKYQETQILMTNEFGLVNCVVGNGTVVQGNMNTVEWDAGNRFLKVEVDTGAGFATMGIQQLVSVPYALESLNSTNAWGVHGNEGTNSTTHFIGTTDEAPLVLKVNNSIVGFLDNTTKNVLLGTRSDDVATDTCNTSIGYQAFGHTYAYGDQNVAIGKEAMFMGGRKSVAIGYEAGKNSNGIYNFGDVMIGYRAGFQNENGSQNVIIGFEAGYATGSGVGIDAGGHRNVFIGYQAGYENIGYLWNESGEENTFIGYQSGYSNGSADTYGGSRNTFMGTYSGANSITGYNNSFFGQSAGFNNTSGSNNTFSGAYAGFQNGDGNNNTFIGTSAGTNNDGASHNTFMGYQSGYENITGVDNVFVGSDAGENNIAGMANTFLGRESGLLNTYGDQNTFVGASAGADNTTGNENTFIGNNAGVNNLDANHNTAIGFDAGGSQTTGGDCTFLGYSAECAAGTFTNATVIGYQASVTASNRVRIGNTSITQIGGQVGWSTLSDARLKQNIRPSSLGLSFINKLKPVNYNYIEGNTDIRYTGFIAQDVEKTLMEMGEEFSGITAPENETDFYSIRYAEFVVPLVNAVQELTLQNEEMKSTLLKVEATTEELKQVIANQQKLIDALHASSSANPSN